MPMKGLQSNVGGRRGLSKMMVEVSTQLHDITL